MRIREACRAADKRVVAVQPAAEHFVPPEQLERTAPDRAAVGVVSLLRGLLHEPACDQRLGRRPEQEGRQHGGGAGGHGDDPRSPGPRTTGQSSCQSDEEPGDKATPGSGEDRGHDE